jgi:nucleoside-diphosphate-sugar epimerase|tara:strand:+ start:356 stop:1216 length:861 start_codon:yes stop_codon:yes gene_type:complete
VIRHTSKLRKKRTLPKLRVLVTGASGQIGYLTFKRLLDQPEKYDAFGIDRKQAPSERVPDDWSLDLPNNRFSVANLSDFEAVQTATEGMDVVVHLGADPEGREWESVLQNNIIGTYNVFETSRLSGVKRIVAASSIMVSAGHRQQEPYKAMMERRLDDIPSDFELISPAIPAEPRGIYGASKVWTESLARVYSNAHGLSCINIRIGQVERDRPRPPQGADIYVSQRDIIQMIEKSINAPEFVRFDTFYGMSNNDHRWVDIDHGRDVIGFVPEDRAENNHDYETPTL